VASAGRRSVCGSWGFRSFGGVWVEFVEDKLDELWELRTTS
jgi:hypothetical protein